MKTFWNAEKKRRGVNHDMEIEVKIPDGTVEELANRVLDEFEYEGKTIRQWANSLTNPMTNADRIRAMTDDELAEMFIRIQYDVAHYVSNADANLQFPASPGLWLDWLKEEAKGDTDEDKA